MMSEVTRARLELEQLQEDIESVRGRLLAIITKPRRY